MYSLPSLSLDTSGGSKFCAVIDTLVDQDMNFVVGACGVVGWTKNQKAWRSIPTAGHV